MSPTLEVLLAPAEFAALKDRDLSGTVCVVFDVLRATSSMITALANGATAILPVAEISEALKIRARAPETLLAGERDGLRIGPNLTGQAGFDLGNSPREFTIEKVSGREIAMTTTNGTRALRACASASRVAVASFLNLKATAKYIEKVQPANLLIVCSGTFEQTAYEDVLGAGALCNLLAYSESNVSDSARMCRRLYLIEKTDLPSALGRSRNGSRLLSRPELHDDVAFCLQQDVFSLVAIMDKEGRVTKAVE